MTVYLLPNGYKIEKVSATGPSSNTTVTAGSAADISISISPTIRALDVISVAKIGGVVDGLAIARIVPSTTGVTIRLFNPTAGDLTQNADTVSVEVWVIGY